MGNRSRSHLTGLDGLRGIAALSVLGYHVSNILSPQVRQRAPEVVFALHQGLTLFFVLSGFLLFLGFADRLIEGRRLPSLTRYATNRALRIWPAYLVVLVVTDVGLGLSFVWPRGTGRLDPGTLLADLTLMQTFAPTTIRTGLEVAWTLTVEATFYAVLPLLAFFASCAGRRAPSWVRASIPIAVLLALGAAGHLWAQSFGHGGPHGWSRDWQSVVSRSLVMHAQLFALGMGAALAYLAVKRGAVTGRGTRILRTCIPAVALAAAALCLADRRSDLAETLAGLCFAALLLVAVLPGARGRAGLLGRTLDLPVLRGLGAISFSVYLWHMPVVRGLDRWLPGLGDGGWWAYAGAVAVVALISTLLATATYIGVERPALRLRTRLSPAASSESSAGPPVSSHHLDMEPRHAVARRPIRGSNRPAGPQPRRREAAAPSGTTAPPPAKAESESYWLT